MANAGTGGVTVALKDRSALYYPRIHFRDLEWLKGTLLAFGRVHRIVPDEHTLDGDSDAVKVLSRRHGAKDPLILEESPEAMFIEDAQSQLYAMLRDLSPPELEARFGASATQVREAETGGAYEIAQAKINFSILDLLERHHLAWQSLSQSGGLQWLRLHPDLGEAIMGVSAIATARARGCDVVTDSSNPHASLAALDERALLETIARPHAWADVEVDSGTVTDLLTHAVLTTHFDLRQLSMDRIRGMVHDGADLRAFRAHLHAYASRLPDTLDPAERAQRIERLRDEVVRDWQELDKRLSPETRSVVRNAATDASASVITDAVKGLASAAVLGTVATIAAGITAPIVVATLVSGIGVPIGIAFVKSLLRSRRTSGDGPTRYLTRLTREGGVLLSQPRPYTRTNE